MIARGLFAVVAVMSFASNLVAGSEYRVPTSGPKIEDSRGRVIASVAYSGTAPPSLVLEDLGEKRFATVTLKGLEDFSPRRAEIAGFRIGRPPTETVVAVQTFTDDSVAGTKQSWTHLFLVVVDANGVVSQAGPVELGKVDLAAPNPNSKWNWVTAASLESGADEPGDSRAGRVLLRDVDGDGFDDVVLWQKTSTAQGTKDTTGKLRSAGESLAVMKYDAARRVYTAPAPVTGLPKPPAALWDASPSVTQGGP